MMKAVIDRYEKNTAVVQLEDGSEILWPMKHLPTGCAEGTVITIDISMDGQAEKDFRASITDIQKRLRKRT